MQAQEHYAGINTSQRTGIISGALNPAELVNITSENEANIITFSANFTNNKMAFSQLWGDREFTDLLFDGNAPANLNADLEILGPSFAFKKGKWAFAITTAGKTKANIKDINPQLGRAVIADSGVDSLAAAAAVLVDYNQSAAATTWGEIGLSAAREIYSDNGHTLNAGVTFKVLFPGSYARMYSSNFTGTIEGYTGGIGLTDASTSLNFAYSGSLGNDFTDSGNFTNYFGNGPHGFAVDFGFNYRWKQETDTGYRINVGLSFRNLGSMKFRDSGNESNTYVLNVPQGEYLNLNQFANVSTISQIEALLLQSGYAKITKQSNDFVAKLPAMFSLYADVKVYNAWYITGYLQQKLVSDVSQNQIPAQNTVTLIPRFSPGKYEFFAPLSSNEISGFAAGLGVRYGGFFIGSGSVLTALLSDGDTHQADAYLGFRWAF
ncbi:hypothetical protein AM493_02175 [Flavobacterium akiainvivens]|uniref:Uncharacterized protein n=2 Tax=Flavobacterium akiainvivens TaxID=1202724 RepID=A0A0M8MGA3_9FLAO|nr:hypothetical protein AM493_02175 [Flavobacterium akiainvivens]